MERFMAFTVATMLGAAFLAVLFQVIAYLLFGAASWSIFTGLFILGAVISMVSMGL